MNVEFLNPLSERLPLAEAAEAARTQLALMVDTSRPLTIPVYRVAGRRRSEWIRLLERHDRGLGKSVILDCSSEGHHISRADLQELAEKSAGLSVIVVTQNLSLIRQVRLLNCPDLKAVYFHSYLFAMFRVYQSQFDNDARRERYIASRRPRAEPPPRRYTCLMQKARPVRLAIFGWLRQHDYLSSGAVSFHRVEEPAALTESAKREFPTFADEIDTGLQEQFPFVNFSDPPGIRRNFTIDIPPYRMSPFSLVVETEMSSGRIRRYTEKTVKAILACHRFVIAGNVNTLSLVRATLDAEAFDHALSSDYDTVVDSETRLRTVLNTLKTYLDMTGSDYVDFLHATWPACEHNFRAFGSAAEREIKTWFRQLEAAIGWATARGALRTVA